jgi:rare lipoprotein A
MSLLRGRTLWMPVLCVALLFGAAKAAALTATGTTSSAQTGVASWYGAREAGRRTPSGIIFDPSVASATHRGLPLGMCVRVTHLGNGRFIVVPVIDRGPYIRGRLIDLSETAADAIGMKQSGLARVRVKIASGYGSAGEFKAALGS